MKFSVDNQIFDLRLGQYNPYLNGIWHWYSSQPGFTGVVALTDFNLTQFNMLALYLELGLIFKGTLSDLLGLLQFMNAEIPRTLDYPEEFLIIKMEEDWYRRHRYSPELDGEWDQMGFLLRVDEDITKSIRQSKDERLKTVKPEKSSMNQSVIGKIQYKLEKQMVRKLREDFHARLAEEYGSSNLLSMEQSAIFGTEDTDVLSHIARHLKWEVSFGVGQLENVCSTFSVNESARTKDWKSKSITEKDHKIMIIRDIMEYILDGTCCIAGGSILNSLSGIRANSDYDFFFYNTTPERANEKLRLMAEIFSKEFCVRSSNAITFARGKIQFILRIYSNIEEILLGFDLDASGVAFDGHDYWMSPRCRYSLRDRVLFVDFDRLSPSYESRLCKYGKNKLFSIFVPELELDESNLTKLMRALEQRNDHEGLLSLMKWKYTGHVPATASDYSPGVSKSKIIVKKGEYETNIPTFYDSYSAQTFGSSEPESESSANSEDSDSDSISPKWIKKFDSYVSLGSQILRVPKGLWESGRMLISREPEFIQLNPGAQVTGSFHRLVLDDLNVWYKGFRATKTESD